MNASLKYYFLNNMGITIWMPRDPSAVLISDQPILNAALLVLLPQKLHQEQKEQIKILTGMLKVLELGTEEWCVAWVRDLTEKSQHTLIVQSINQWSPYHVLVMGEALAQFLLNDSKSLDELRTTPHSIFGLEPLLQVTYHPAQLEKSPENKRKSYQDLLRLKLQISQARVE